MLVQARRICANVPMWLLLAMLAVPLAHATIAVSVPDANTAVADISLTDSHANTFAATVTFKFDHALNLSADSLGIDAALFDPASPPGSLPLSVSVDPAFPMVISVEPPVALFTNGYESNQAQEGNLAFFNTYEIEIHTANLSCNSSASSYRLYKAPHGSSVFADLSDDIYQGSVRARGRGGAFSRFILVRDNRLTLTTALEKLATLTTRLNLATITNGTLLASLTAALANVSIDLLTLNVGAALNDLQVFIDGVAGAAGVDIPNEWKADRSLVNDAGELLSLAQTLQFTLRVLQGGNALCLPPPG
jgi:hypothetical protein